MAMKRSVCLGIALLVGLGSLLTGVLVVLKFRDLIDAFIKSELPLRRGTEPFELWRKPPVTPMLKVWFFNVTNAEEFLENSEKVKLRLREVGPYVYSEKWEKVGVEWHPNGTVSYRTTKLYFFEPTLSIGAENDTFVLPNVPLISAVNQMQHSTRTVKLAVATLLDILKLAPFVKNTVKEIMWGYDDPLIKLGKQVLQGNESLPYDKFGYFVDRNRTESKVFTVFTGQENLDDFARIDAYDGKKKLRFWKTDQCNMINGTDGTGFPSPLTNTSELYLFQPDLCRSLHLKYNYSVKHQDLPAYRFMPTPDTFGDVETYPENDCYCVDGPPCSKRGLFNISKCQFGSPIMLSWPHFLHGDPTLLEDVEGLSPDPAKHQFYLDIQPKLGIAMQAKGRVQINVQMSQVKQIPQTANLSNVLVPILWFEDGIDELPPKITSLIRQAVNVPEIARKALSYVTFILGGILLAGAAIYIVLKQRRPKAVENGNGMNGHSKKAKSDDMTNNLNGNTKHQYTNSSVELEDKKLKLVKNGADSNHAKIEESR